MQYKDEKILEIIKALGEIIREIRRGKREESLNLFAYSYDLNPSNLSRIENGQIEPKVTTLWKIAEALDIPLSELIRNLENKLGDGFSLIDK